MIPKRPAENRPAGCSDFLEQRNIPLLPARFALLTATCREGLGPARRSSVRLHNCTGPVANYRGQLACLTGRPAQMGPTNGTGRAQAGGAWRATCGEGEQWTPQATGGPFTYARCKAPTGQTGWLETGVQASAGATGRLKNGRGNLICE